MTTLRVRALFFALYRDVTGTESLDLELPDGATARSAVEAVRGRGAGFARLPERPVVAVNHEYATLDAPLCDGDEVAFLPPVAGG